MLFGPKTIGNIKIMLQVASALITCQPKKHGHLIWGNIPMSYRCCNQLVMLKFFRNGSCGHFVPVSVSMLPRCQHLEDSAWENLPCALNTTIS